MARCQFLSTLSLRRATANTGRNGLWPKFLSTLSLRRATDQRKQPEKRQHHFYPRSPCGERHGIFNLDGSAQQFLSTLSLRRATGAFDAGDGTFGFLSTLSLRRATVKRAVNPLYGKISIHALLAESDLFRLVCNAVPLISIHALLAESDITRILKKATLPISIHALLAESDEQRL